MDKKTKYSNIPPSIEAKIGRNLHNQPNHPIQIIKMHIYKYFNKLDGYSFQTFDDFAPFVPVVENFDKLLIPKDHPARSKSDTYYLNETTVLRTHTSAHQSQLLAKGFQNFLVTGDVYRKDEIDRCHYPVFHQMEGVGLVPDKGTDLDKDPKKELLRILGGLVEHLFPGCEYRVNDDYFPFTDPSFEFEVKYNEEWLEILGCGVMQPEIAKSNPAGGVYWAFGLGLERLCMILFKVPDIRYFWSQHPRFLGQFKESNNQDYQTNPNMPPGFQPGPPGYDDCCNSSLCVLGSECGASTERLVECGIIAPIQNESVGTNNVFQPYSELPNQYNDISFWIPPEQVPEVKNEKGELEKRWIQDNTFYELVREVAGDWVEKVELKDEFYHPKKKLESRMYRITYSPNDPGLDDPGEFTKIVNGLQNELRDRVEAYLNVKLR